MNSFTKNGLVIVASILGATFLHASDVSTNTIPVSTNNPADVYSGISGPGEPVQGSGLGGWRSGREGVRYKGPHPKNTWQLDWDAKESSSDKVIELGLLPPIKPIWELHLRDTIITLGGDGLYYMTGSSGDNIWDRNDGVELWKSDDMKTWDYVGLVWTLAKDATWQRGARYVWAPEIHYLKNKKTYVITLCVGGGANGTGLLVSTTGKPEGPYVNPFKPDARVTGGIDATIFEDDDGKIYYTSGHGDTIYQLKDDLSASVDGPHRIQLDPASQQKSRALGVSSGVGSEGPSLFKRNGKYYLGGAHFIGGVNRQTGRNGRYSSCVAVADNIYGPYTMWAEAVPCGAGGNYFQDKAGDWYCTYFGNDEASPFREKPGLVRIDFEADGRIKIADEQPAFILRDGAPTHWRNALAKPAPTSTQTPTIQMAPPAAGLPALPAVLRNETQEQQDARLKWFREARFGLFIHWGVYAVPAGTWQGRRVGAEWIMNQGKIPVADYRALATNFTAAKYDPKAWAQLAEDAGIKYVVITAKHHEGFALFDSAYSDWNAVKASGAKRDLIQPLAEAVRAKGMKFGTYYSQSQDWVNLGGGKGNTPPWDDEQKKGDFDEYLKKISLPQARELLEKYNPDILWWDTEYQMTPERARPFFDLVTSHPHLIHNSRLGGGVLGDFRTSEQRIPASAMLGRALEVNMTINNSWGYRSDDLNWKSAQQLIRNLSDITSKDGNYLLNVGPTAEGVIPQPEVERLLAIGRWLKVNGEAIYATRGSIYPKPLPWGRTTQKAKTGGGTTLYLHVWEWPADGKILLPEIKQAARAGRLLAGGATVTSTVTPEGIVVTLPGSAPDPDVSVVALEFDRTVEVMNAAALPTDTGASGALANPSKSSPPAK